MCCAGFWLIVAVMLLFAAAFDCRDALACNVLQTAGLVLNVGLPSQRF